MFVTGQVIRNAENEKVLNWFSIELIVKYKSNIGGISLYWETRSRNSYGGRSVCGLLRLSCLVLLY